MKKRELPPLIAVAVILLGLSLATLLLPDRTFSPNENRYLQQVPKLTVDRLFSGKFTEEAEKYESDQVALRDVWMGAASTLQRFSGRRDINGVYLGKDGYLFARLTEDDFDQKQYEKNLAAVRTFMDGHTDLDCRILLAPTPAAVLAELLPKNAPVYDAALRHTQLADAVGQDRVIDVREALAALPEPYYRTDHHWTTAGALAAYEVWCRDTGREAADWKLTAVTDDFRGTLYSKVLLPNSPCDTITLPADASVRSVDCDGTVTDSLYRMEELTEKDKYKVFQGGNWARVTIETGTENGRRLLLVKDSFANCFVPFLTEHFETVTMLDLRHFTESLDDLVEQQGITDVLVLYELSNFAEDRNLFKLNQAG
ncbi:MAG: hypothetical protein IJL51_01305 [Oscillospiraceae bacterium]|nr:hypothetical protein [Oscillospiraceae bacterium]